MFGATAYCLCLYANRSLRDRSLREDAETQRRERQGRANRTIVSRVPLHPGRQSVHLRAGVHGNDRIGHLHECARELHVTLLLFLRQISEATFYVLKTHLPRSGLAVHQNAKPHESTPYLIDTGVVSRSAKQRCTLMQKGSRLVKLFGGKVQSGQIVANAGLMGHISCTLLLQ